MAERHRRQASSRGRAVAGVVALLASGVVASGCDLLPARSEGERLWRQRCTECHGRDGSGNTPRYMGDYRADLLDETWEHGSDKGSWEVVIREGVFGHMPGAPELTSDEVQALVDYLRELREKSSGTRG